VPPETPTPPIRFGTDGWRGVIADDFTEANVATVVQAAATAWDVSLLATAWGAP